MIIVSRTYSACRRALRDSSGMTLMLDDASSQSEAESNVTAKNQQTPGNRILAAASRLKRRKGKVTGSLIAISSAAIVSVYTVGRANSSAAYDRITGADAPSAAVAAPPTSGQSTEIANVTYRDGTYTGSGDSRHGGMQVTVVIKDGKITSADVTSCATRYPCSDINPLIRSAVSKQRVPTNHVSGATDSSKAYNQALTNALQQAKA